MKKVKLTGVLITAALLFNLFVMPEKAFAYGSVNYDNFNESKSSLRILYGVVLVAGGAFLAYDGFRTVKVDQSRPSVRLNFSSYWYEENLFGVDKYAVKTAGIIENTGNVDLTNVDILLRYNTQLGNHYPVLGAKVTYAVNSSSGPLANLSINESQGWAHDANWPAADVDVGMPEGGGSPGGEYSPEYVDYNVDATYPPLTSSAVLVDIVDISYDYTKKYKSEMNNVYEGLLGVLLIGGGAYLLIDYIVSIKRFDYFMKKNNMNFYVANNGEEFKLMLSKKI